MSDYWKSAPKYWCKHCGVYVRDTKLERTNHENAGKHKSNLNKFLRSIHRDNEQEQRDKQRAKDEVARLNGLLSTKDQDRSPNVLQTIANPQFERQALGDERKRQIEELAKLGVAIPDEYRQDLAMVSEWCVVRNTLHDNITTVNSENITKLNPNGGHPRMSLKRKVEESSNTEFQVGEPRQITWGSATKTYRDAKENADDIDVLLSDAQTHKNVKVEGTEQRMQPKQSQVNKIAINTDDIKEQRRPVISAETVSDEQVVFKKRRSKISKG